MAFAPEVRDRIEIDLDSNKAYSWCILGATRSGKSTLLNYLNEKYNQKKINIIMTESPNADIMKSAQSLKNDCLLCPGWMPKLVQTCYKINRGTDNHYNFNFILDDLVGFSHSKVMKKIMTVYRNSQIGVMITGQTTGILNPQAKSNINIVALGKMNSDMEIQNVIRYFLLSWFPTKMNMTDKIKCYKIITEENRFIFINNLTGEIFVSKVKLN
jgi:energy-coupling factor transporter ATP-binding protein EcfA2